MLSEFFEDKSLAITIYQQNVDEINSDYVENEIK